jgi:hypothetical protein
MKKALFASFLFVLLLGSRSVYAQAGKLTITNTGYCDIQVVMYAVCTDCNNPYGCELISYPFIVSALSSRGFTSPVDFFTSVGWATTAGGPLSLNCLTLSTEFQWTDASFCFPYCDPNYCPSSTLPPAPCNYVNDDALNTSGSGQHCFSTQNPWTVSGYCTDNAKWVPASGAYMANVAITFW